MKPYPDYKPTGLAWLPEIPKHWTTRKIKYIFRERSEKGYPDEPLLAATQNHGVIPKNLYGARTVEAQKDLHLLKLVRVGDFVISLRSFQGGIEYAYYQGIISPAYTIMIPDSCLIDSGYFRYLAKSPNFIALLQTCVTGIREGQNIDYSTLRRHCLPLPPADEQAQIVRYLDAMTAKINKLIRAKKRQIALLQEQKQAIINQAVTRGLDPDVELKDSGIDWLGPIPKQWQIVRMKNLFSFINRGTTPDYIEDRSYTKVVNQATFSKGYWDETQIRFTRVSPDIARGLLKQNDVLLASTGGGVLGKVYLFIQNGTYIADSHVTILRTQRKDVSPAYFFALLSTMYDFINAKLAKGSTNQTELQKDLLCSLVVPFPDIETQNVIVDFLDQKINIINLLIQQYQKIIEQYAEYKNSLIAAVVTGKVDVRNIAVEAVSAEDLTPSDDPDESEEQDSPVSEESEE